VDDWLFPRAFERAHEAFVAADAGGVITAWNPAAERFYGYTAAEAVGRPLDLLCFPEERADFAGLYAAPEVNSGTAIERGAPAPRAPGHETRQPVTPRVARVPPDAGPRELIRRQRHKSGRELWAALRLARVELPGLPPSLLLCAIDVTGRQRAEDVAAQSRAALEASRAELRRVAARLVAGEEDVRRRIARELHDDFSQRLAALAIEVKLARTRLADDGESRHGMLEPVGRGLLELAQDLRRVSHALHPAALERHGLATALRDHCADVERRSRLRVRLGLRDAEGRFPPDVELGLYRIAQEALANVVRHADAHTARVTLRVADGAVHLSVADDGTGFDPAAARRAGGLGLASIEERTRLLGGHCTLVSAPATGTEIEACVPLPAPEPAEAVPAGEDPAPRTSHVGPYRLIEELGSGVTATLYLAEEPQPLGRRVALKLHRGPLAGRRETLRFKAEQQALARLHHPAIADVYEARTTPDGDLYIAMEYVAGLPITAYCDRYGLDLRRRLELFATICDGVQHAHQKGVVHRDIKPSNILVMEEDGRPLPKIIDFGAAKGVDRPLVEGTLRDAQELVGTPPYLAPEALRGGELDTRSDVYSLGVVLYELLVGTVPLAADGEGAGLAGWVDAVRRGRVPAPSRRLRALAAGDATAVARARGFGEPSRLVRRLAGDLERVASKAVALDPAERYPTVDALRKEIERVLRGQPVEAGPEGALHQLGRLARRHRRLVASTALVILALATGLVATLTQARRAQREALRADAVVRFLEDLFKASDPRQARGRPPDAREILRRGTERLGSELHDQPLLRARLLDTLGGIDTELGLFAEARPLLEEALAIRERRRGGAHPEVADTLVRLGTLAHLSGKGDAEPLFRRALAIREARLGSDHADVADVLNKLGAALAARGRLDEAEAALRRALPIGEQAWGRDDPRVAKLLHNLSGIAYTRGRSAEAEQFLMRALAVRERILPEDDPDLAGSREALALLRQQQGRPAEAAALLERVVASAERVYGPEHPAVARALLNLGLTRRDLGEDAAARRTLERALALMERTLAPDHPQRVRALASLAELHCQHGRYAEAEPLFRRLMALRAAGASYDGWPSVLASWAALLRATGRAAEAAAVESPSASSASPRP
jgi:non-specific serine/threonine protein kinase/serine/threonine-protein kinase